MYLYNKHEKLEEIVRSLRSNINNELVDIDFCIPEISFDNKSEEYEEAFIIVNYFLELERSAYLKISINDFYFCYSVDKICKIIELSINDFISEVQAEACTLFYA